MRSAAGRWRARSGVRTRTALTGRRGLSPPRLPIPSSRLADTVAADRPCLDDDQAATVVGWSSATAAPSHARHCSPCGPVSPLATATPSIMSASTAGHGRLRSATATTKDPSGRRRSVRCAPATPGGLRKLGMTQPIRRDAAARWRTVSAKWRDTACCTHSSSARHKTAWPHTNVNRPRPRWRTLLGSVRRGGAPACLGFQA